MQLYDLAGKDAELRFSPYCWRAKMALRHKQLEVETLPWRFTEKDRIGPTRQGRVPVLVDGDRWLHDSWQIACYLDEAYPDRPALMATAAERAAARFVSCWSDLSLHAALRPLILMDVYQASAEKDRAYFRDSREKMLGMPLDKVCPDREVALQTFHRVLSPVESTLGEFDYLGGPAPNFADYVVFGSLQWANVVSPTDLLPGGSAVAAWFGRILELFDGYGRKARTVAKAAAA